MDKKYKSKKYNRKIIKTSDVLKSFVVLKLSKKTIYVLFKIM